jgi:hypothetical protein
VFVNPYTGQVLGAQVPDERLMQQIKRLHGRLLVGNVGKAIVELASGWMFVLLISGFYLWYHERIGAWGEPFCRVWALENASRCGICMPWAQCTCRSGCASRSFRDNPGLCSLPRRFAGWLTARLKAL